MTIEEAVRARLLEIAAVTALVGSRIWLVMNPQSPVHPSVRVQVITDRRAHHLRGPNGLREASVQVDGYVRTQAGADAYAQAVSLATAIEGDGLGEVASGLDGWIGAVGSSAVVIRDCLRTMRYGPRYDPDELQTLTVTQEFRVTYER